jgi:hypothetical protein
MFKPKWFVMLRGNFNVPLPLVNLEDEVVLFDSRQDAEKSANNTMLGENFGFVVYLWQQ